ncbi:MAG: hypothetical protein II001_04140 [Bacteroidales bacterium]|nr:hypothetical protein [Bacteroidales bacterium]
MAALWHQYGNSMASTCLPLAICLAEAMECDGICVSLQTGTTEGYVSVGPTVI